MTFLNKYWKDILVVILFLICIVLIMSTTCTNQKNKTLQTNIEALNDSVKTYQLKNGELMYERQGFILEKKELEEYIDISKSEIRDLEKKLKSSLATIARLEGQVRIDTLVLHDSIYQVQDTTFINFYYSDQWLKMDGTSVYCPSFSRTTLNNLTMNVPLKIGTSTSDQWFVSTDNPYVEFTEILGANVEKSKPKRWSFGVQIGIGLTVGCGITGANDGIVRTGWFFGPGGYVGIGGTYKLIEF